MSTPSPETFEVSPVAWCATMLAAAAIAYAGAAHGDDTAVPAKGPPIDLKLAETLAPAEAPKARSWWKKLTRCDDGSAASEGWLRHLSTGASAPAKLFGTP